MTGIRVERADGIATVTIDRADKRNALTLAMWRELARVFQAFAQEPDVRVVILTGAGGHFCAGSDIAEFAELRRNGGEGAAYEHAVDAAADAIQALAKPTIAAIDGFCIGGGCGLALACDLRWAGDGASFAITSAKVGLIYGHRETRNLVLTVGMPAAKRILFAGRKFDGEMALSLGFVDERVEGPALPAAWAFAAEIAQNAPLSLAGSKRMIGLIAAGADDPDAPEFRAMMAGALDSADYREGRAAFAERRKPVFTGR
jgi:enoyl-CoA hydratase/carnithine racemase